MPGLSQLKKFNSDILALGKEPELRASRGEKPVTVPIPRSIKDTDDSEDFVLGMPETEEEQSAPDESLQSADDFSDITGDGRKQPDAAEQGGQKPSAAPDVSDLLNPLDMAGPAAADDVPDLSQFMEPPQEPEPEPEPEPPSIADLSLDDLLNSAGFDGGAAEDGSQPADQQESGEQPENVQPEQEPEDLEPAEPEHHGAAGKPAAVKPAAPAGVQKKAAPQEVPPEQPAADQTPPADFDFNFDTPEVPADSFNEPAPVQSSEPEPGQPAAGQPQADDFDSASQTIDMNAGLPDEMNEPDAGTPEEEPSEPEPLEPEPLEPEEVPPSTDEAVPADASAGTGQPEEAPASESSSADLSADDFSVPDFDASALDMPQPDDTAAPAEEPAGSAGAVSAEESVPAGESVAEEPAAEEQPSGEQVQPEAEDGSEPPPSGDEDFNPDSLDFNLDDSGDTSSPADSGTTEESAPAEKFDTSDMDGLDFSIKDTDSKLADEEKTDFELGKGSDFKDENSDFEIPGFSDTDSVKEDKGGHVKLPTPDFAGAVEGDKPGKNALSDEQYKRFRSNLADYPLNVRIAVENLLVKNEFTDDAQFEVIQKIISRAPARQVAAHLEKMLDISISVPRDFERRTAAEYDAYKSSLQYQLKNRIIPGVIAGLACLVVLFGLFKLGQNLIYKPLKASSLYRQGYTLLQADEYPQSEMKFNEAVKYQMQKKWFYRYAQGYREHKQYQRAEKMFRNILYCFNHDKPAGIQYAQMECDDLANYEKAEEIARREVLDYHINDPDGILLLGDIYLEWGTEKDPAKFEDARKQYATLVQLYGQTDLYMSRMMRYFIRTDNLREVLQLKERFYPKEKSLAAQDWTELSGYMLDKLYGPLAPADEYLRRQIEDVKDMLVRAVKADAKNPVAYYNLSRYFVQMNDNESAVKTLEHTIDVFKKAPSLKRRDTYKEIDSYRLLGEQYSKQKEYLKAQENYADGITLFTDERTSSGFEGNEQVGRLYADAGDIDYFIRGDLDSAYQEYTTAVDTKYDTSSLHYRIGYIEYGRGDYDKAAGSFIKASEDNPEDNHLLLAMGNTLSLRDDNYAAQGYYDRLISRLDTAKEQKGLLMPQVRADQAEIVELYLKASNNLGVTLYRLASRTGSSRMNADAMVQLSTSMRAWDALTRNQTTMVRLGGSNLAEQNMRYMSHPVPDYEPAIYTDIPRILSGEEELSQ